MKDLDLNSLNIGLCISKFNYEHVGILENSIFDELVKLGIREKNILRLFVPGALELPLLLARCVSVVESTTTSASAIFFTISSSSIK